MQFCRYRDREGNVGHGREWEPGRVEALRGDPWRGLEPTGKEVEVAQRLAPLEPVNIYCIGINYRAHAEETGVEQPEHPVVFMKPTSTVQRPGGPIRLPACSRHGPEVDYEAELGVVIGRAARDVPEAEALDYVYGYTCANDVSARRWQKHGGGGQWIRGKSFDGFCPLGPVLVTADEIPDPQDLRLRSLLNGQVMQDGHTSRMIHGVAGLIAFLSQDTTLLPGTLILTGTPDGVGFTRNPPVFLKPGDEIVVEVEGIGRLVNPVVAA